MVIRIWRPRNVRGMLEVRRTHLFLDWISGGGVSKGDAHIMTIWGLMSKSDNSKKRTYGKSGEDVERDGSSLFPISNSDCD
jgi:hypothetical protein